MNPHTPDLIATAMNLLIVIFLVLIAASLAVGLFALFSANSQMLKWSLTIRIVLSVAIFALFIVYSLLKHSGTD
ncbi:MAG: hypothetical protein K0U66_07970 [Gammaproteobacteria bacterium]|nr:hypothetical protein [Pseudomonadota bacterium]MCH9663577.1 hypothetical protein [Gammaproteobacteria bacterium]